MNFYYIELLVRLPRRPNTGSSQWQYEICG